MSACASLLGIDEPAAGDRDGAMPPADAPAGPDAEPVDAAPSPPVNLGSFAAIANLPAPRMEHVSFALSDKLYVFGGSLNPGGGAGEDAGGGTKGGEVFVINGDGSLGASTPAGSLGTIRRGAAVVRVTRGTSDWIYVLGGLNSNGYLNSLERTTVNPDGTIGGFMPVGVAMATERAYATAFVRDDDLYVISGEASGFSLSIEHVSLDANGNIVGGFSAAGSLQTAQSRAALGVGEDQVVIMGGIDNNTGPDFTTVETASVDAMGTLGVFSISGSSSLVFARSGCRAVQLADRLHVLGGGSTQNEKAILGVGGVSTFTVLGAGSLDVDRRQFTVNYVPSVQRVYVIGGCVGVSCTNGPPLNSIIAAPVN